MLPGNTFNCDALYLKHIYEYERGTQRAMMSLNRIFSLHMPFVFVEEQWDDINEMLKVFLCSNNSYTSS